MSNDNSALSPRPFRLKCTQFDSTSHAVPMQMKFEDIKKEEAQSDERVRFCVFTSQFVSLVHRCGIRHVHSTSHGLAFVESGLSLLLPTTSTDGMTKSLLADRSHRHNAFAPSISSSVSLFFLARFSIARYRGTRSWLGSAAIADERDKPRFHVLRPLRLAASAALFYDIFIS